MFARWRRTRFGAGREPSSAAGLSRELLGRMMMSLPFAFGTTIETIPGDMPYLKAGPASAATWRPA